MSTPLTDSINALTAYADETTGASDTTLSDAVYTLAQGYGRGGASNISDLLKARFESQGYVFTSFTPSTPTSGNYIDIPHTLGRVPTNAIAFNKIFVLEDSATMYQLGYVENGAFGQDNNSNRTYQIFNRISANYTDLSFGDILKIAPFIPFIGLRTLWNFTNAATSTTIGLRNQSNNANTAMKLGEWWLGVK